MTIGKELVWNRIKNLLSEICTVRKLFETQVGLANQFIYVCELVCIDQEEADSKLLSILKDGQKTGVEEEPIFSSTGIHV